LCLQFIEKLKSCVSLQWIYTEKQNVKFSVAVYRILGFQVNWRAAWLLQCQLISSLVSVQEGCASISHANLSSFYASSCFFHTTEKRRCHSWIQNTLENSISEKKSSFWALGKIFWNLKVEFLKKAETVFGWSLITLIKQDVWYSAL